MPRYIDADDFIKTLEADIKEFGEPDINTQPIAYGSVLGIECALDSAKEFPTADVVPKSEVEKLQNELVIWKQNRFNLYQKLECYETARQKVAKEIFEEIDNNLQESKDCVSLVRIFKLTKFIAELKEKYTEGEE